MPILNPEHRVRKLLNEAEIEINGNNQGDIHVHNPKLYSRVMAGGSLALGESYMDGWWDSDRLDVFFTKLLQSNIQDKVQSDPATILAGLHARIFNSQQGNKAFEIGKRHYDMGNALFERMLGKTMAYSCAFFDGVKDLDHAQTNKINTSLNKLHAKPGMTLLDIGCGWGSIIHQAASTYKLDATGITVSHEQKEWSNRAIAADNLEGSARVKYQKWQDLPSDQQYDRIISIGAFEHFGYKNYKSFFEKVRSVLKDDGIFLLHTIGGLTPVHANEPWLEKYIFPHSMLPAMSQISKASTGVLAMKHVEEKGRNYDPTLMAWYTNLDKNWEEIRKTDPSHYDTRFRRMMDYYLLMCAGTFRSGKNQVWQIIFTKDPSIEYRLAA